MLRRCYPLFLVFIFLTQHLFAQVTTSAISGTVKANGEPLPNATVTAIHTPSGTKYVTSTGSDGGYNFPNVRVGGPYAVTASFTGFKPKTEGNVYANLGLSGTADFIMNTDVSSLEEITVVATRGGLINAKKTGAAMTLGRETINRAPTIGRTINDVTKFNPYGNGRSFAGQDTRFNNFTIDGSVFNNGFGLGSQAQAGGRTGSSAISLDALEELQLNIAPFDIRQSGFAGAAINAVTRSGTNEFAGSVFHYFNNRNLAGNKADTSKVPTTPFKNTSTGFRIGGPILKNKLFFFINGEFVRSNQPALTRVLSRPGATGNVSGTTAADLEDLKSFMMTNFNYDMGALDGFNNESFSNKLLARIDYNINDKNKLSFRYAHHDSQSDVIISNSNSGLTAGNGDRQNSTNTDAISAQNTGYIVMDNTRSFVAELNSSLRKNLANQLLVTYNKQIEDRAYRTQMFPTIDILKNGKTYTTIGFDPFTPNNRLDYSTFNITNNVNIFKGKHTMTAGASFEAFKSNNLFFYASNGVWVFNSIDDFKTAALAYKNNPNLTTSPVAINRFNYRYTLLPDGQLPWQTLKTNTTSLYFQDEYKVAANFRLTGGVRLDYINVANTAKDYYNPVVAGLTFKNPDGSDLRVNTSTMPKSGLYVSPRLGFNWDVKGNRQTQIRGGTGVFLSRMPYVLISNQLGNNGVNIGLVNATGNTALNYPFTLDPTRYTPATTDINTLSGYNINASVEKLRFPQIWKTNLAIDQKLPWLDMVATVEGLYNKNINALNYFDANLKPSNATLASGPDKREIYPALDLSGSAATTARFINSKIGSVYMLSNNNVGYSYSLTTKVERPIIGKWGALLGYTYAKATDLSFVGSTVNVNVPTIYGVNYLRQGYSENDLRHRFIGTASYRLNYGNKIGGGTTFTLACVSASGGKISYTTARDLNGDGQANDLLFVPQKASDLNFVDYTTTVNKVTYSFTKAQQEAAFQEYINNSDYLSKRKGQYAERNGAEYPWLTRFDLSAEQDFIVKVSGKNNILRFRIDVMNFGNLLNSKWGVGYLATSTQPITYSGRDASGTPKYNLSVQTLNGQTTLLNRSFYKSATINDVYQIQLGIRYIFNY